MQKSVSKFKTRIDKASEDFYKAITDGSSPVEVQKAKDHLSKSMKEYLTLGGGEDIVIVSSDKGLVPFLGLNVQDALIRFKELYPNVTPTGFRVIDPLKLIPYSLEEIS